MFSGKELKKEQDKIRALELHCQGHTYQQIAYELGCSKVNAYALVEQGQSELLEEQQTNLNTIRNEILFNLRTILKERFKDLTQCRDEIGEDGKMYRDGLRGRGLITRDILSILQELAKIQGIYLYEEIKSYLPQVASQEDDFLADFEAMDEETLKLQFAEYMRNHL